MLLDRETSHRLNSKQTVPTRLAMLLDSAVPVVLSKSRDVADYWHPNVS